MERLDYSRRPGPIQAERIVSAMCLYVKGQHTLVLGSTEAMLDVFRSVGVVTIFSSCKKQLEISNLRGIACGRNWQIC